MMDPTQVNLKFKPGHGGNVIAYCDSCPGVTGEGKDQGSAENHFWKNFNKQEVGAENAARSKKHAAAAATVTPVAGGKQGQGTPKKKAA